MFIPANKTVHTCISGGSSLHGFECSCLQPLLSSVPVWPHLLNRHSYLSVINGLMNHWNEPSLKQKLQTNTNEQNTSSYWLLTWIISTVCLKKTAVVLRGSVDCSTGLSRTSSTTFLFRTHLHNKPLRYLVSDGMNHLLLWHWLQMTGLE